jgi:hypothetical protein
LSALGGGIGVRAGGIKDYKVEKSGKYSTEVGQKVGNKKAKKPAVCWSNKGSWAIFASKLGNICYL